MTALDLNAIDRRWSIYGGMGNPRGADDYEDAGCRIFAEHGFRDIPALVARVRELEDALTVVREECRLADLDAKVNAATANRAEQAVERVRAEVDAIDGLSREPLSEDMTSAFRLCLRGLRAALDPQEES